MNCCRSDLKAEGLTFRRVWLVVMTRADRLLVLILILLGLASYSLLERAFPRAADAAAVVEVGGREVVRLSLSPDLPARKVPLEIEGGIAELEVSGGKIRILPMSDSLCPKHVCSKRGWIGKPWEMIVCMPNRITVRIAGGMDGEGVDLMTK